MPISITSNRLPAFTVSKQAKDTVMLPLSFCDRSFKKVRTALTAVDAAIKAVVYKALYLLSVLFFLKERQIRYKFYYHSNRQRVNRFFTFTNYEKQLINFSSNDSKYQPQLVKNTTNDFKLSEKVYGQEFTDLKVKADQIGYEIKPNNFNYTQDGVCLGAVLHFIAQFHKHSKTHNLETSIKQTSNAFENEQPNQATLLQMFYQASMKHKLLYAKLFLDLATAEENIFEHKKELQKVRKVQKDKLYTEKKSLDPILYLKRAEAIDEDYESSLQKYLSDTLEKIDAVRCRTFQQIESPVAKLIDLNIKEGETIFNTSYGEDNATEALKDFLNSLASGSYMLSHVRGDPFGHCSHHAMALIKGKHDLYYLFDANNGTFCFKGDNAISQLQSYLEKQYISNYKLYNLRIYPVSPN